jgi:hypothetical protein
MLGGILRPALRIVFAKGAESVTIIDTYFREKKQIFSDVNENTVFVKMV